MAVFQDSTPIALTAILLAGVGSAHADLKETDFGLFRPQVGVQFRDNDLSEGVDDHALFVRGTLPIWEGMDTSEDRTTFYQLLGLARFGRSRPIVSLLPDRPTIYTGDVRLAGMIFTSAKNLYVLAPGVSFAEEKDTVDELVLRFSLIALGTYVLSDTFGWLYGAYFAYDFGRGLIVPGLGFYWSPAEDWSLVLLLPALVRLGYQLTPRLNLALSAGFAGERSRLENGGDFVGQPDTVHLRIGEVRTGLSAVYKMNRTFSWRLDAGYLALRRFALADGNDEFESDRVSPSAYANIGLDVSFGEALWER